MFGLVVVRRAGLHPVQWSLRLVIALYCHWSRTGDDSPPNGFWWKAGFLLLHSFFFRLWPAAWPNQYLIDPFQGILLL